MTSTPEPDYPSEAPASVPELRRLLREHSRARCDGLLGALLQEPVMIGQLVTISWKTYRVCGVAGTPIRWLDPRPYFPALAGFHPHGVRPDPTVAPRPEWQTFP
ncbi:hypothetical protein [Actinoplanes sp. NPDC051851]|uniref:hypothetical protein n=1 Tax=Actinoplanes sp. NPDC051851 TaxID=3154753 RepID=UPI00341B6690